MIKQRDSALQEAHMWRTELAKARDRVVILEAAVVRAEEKVRVTEADAEARLKEAVHKESVALKDKEDLLAYVNKLQAQLQRFGSYLCWAIYKSSAEIMYALIWPNASVAMVMSFGAPFMG